jgi:hypothetical protein
MMPTWSIRSAVNAVNLVNVVNAVNAVENRPPPGGVERANNQMTIALTPSDDFGEIIDNRATRKPKPPVGLRCYCSSPLD